MLRVNSETSWPFTMGWGGGGGLRRYLLEILGNAANSTNIVGIIPVISYLLEAFQFLSRTPKGIGPSVRILNLGDCSAAYTNIYVTYIGPGNLLGKTGPLSPGPP